ncbi:hypothetical protein A1O3_07688 [Capronia epimyces CBS 606.96]|uniref:Mannosyltransferase n=1 Tax=Capronia epimyces CBS 606.96 TaxID=1182542 RepID=W9XLL1_9EURO|nr:uncharacterized protein A1O3_07688 [Capronia epimyces CBS 606.96]EXJ81397.1 hypothetical protein A1O3_07688 [Capronia epimyces CBS 606.96]
MGDNVDKETSRPDTALKDTAVTVAAPATATNVPGASPSPSQRFLLPNNHNLFLLLIGFRLLNALTVQTFFQPDEYFQALEPAWRLAFGEDAGAWITWEWKSHLRSAIHPTVFALWYRGACAVADFFHLEAHAQAELLLAAPKSLQAIFAAVTDFYTWKLASYAYGTNSSATLATLLLTVTSPWHWFGSTRTFSNCLETTLTVVALYHWPWHWQLPLDNPGAHVVRVRQQVADGTDIVTRLRRALLCAALATILRPTNILVWGVLTWLTFLRGWKSIGPSWAECSLFARETVLCGGLVLLLSTLIDRIFYDSWVFPPLDFLHVNVVQSIATFYGNNDWHYYLSQGYPLLLTTALPFTLAGLYRVLSPSSGTTSSEATPPGRTMLSSLSIVCLLVPSAFSNIAHKEVRFIYPLLPALHVVTGLPLSSFFGPQPSQHSGAAQFTHKMLLALLLALNISVAYYTTQVHNSGIIELTHYLRTEFETTYLPAAGVGTASNMTVGMLMPCHSTPWRSHLQYPPSTTRPGIHAWALTCEPPLNLNATERTSYLDEADQFYADPLIWLKKNMSRHPPRAESTDGMRANGVFARDERARHGLHITSESTLRQREEELWSTGQSRRRPWPEYLVFFAQLEPTLTVALRGSGYGECHRLFNSHWHDDWRRTGDVVIWCLDQERQDARRSSSRPSRLPAEEQIELEDAVRNRDRGRHPSAESLALGRGQQVMSVQKTPKTKTKTSAPVTRVVEKPFWKAREPERKDT